MVASAVKNPTMIRATLLWGWAFSERALWLSLNQHHAALVKVVHGQGRIGALAAPGEGGRARVVNDLCRIGAILPQVREAGHRW